MNVELVDSKDVDPVAGGLEIVDAIHIQVEHVEGDRSDAMIDEWGRQSFPASDPPSNW